MKNTDPCCCRHGCECRLDETKGCKVCKAKDKRLTQVGEIEGSSQARLRLGLAVLEKLDNTFPMTGAYQNDCPFCKTHNALLQQFSLQWKYQCRDCKRVFTANYEAKTFTLEAT